MEQSTIYDFMKKPEKTVREIVIYVREASQEEGYMYDIYDCTNRIDDGIDAWDNLDGGLCTGSADDAIEMASEQAKAFIN